MVLVRPLVAFRLEFLHLRRIIESMRIEELTKLFKRQPFRPFTIHMSDGSAYTAAHPDQVILTPRAAYVGIGNGEDDAVVQDVIICDMVHITRLGPEPKRPRKRRK